MTLDTILRGAVGSRRYRFPIGVDEPPLFTADWRDAVFAHFAVEPDLLQRSIPFLLDTRGGNAFVSLVAFTQVNLRPAIGGHVTSLLISPVARHAFLNLRTYVRVDGVRGIFFIAEWIPNRLAVLLGQRTYGLPYRLGKLRYAIDERRRRARGRVHAAGGGAFKYVAEYSEESAPASIGSLDEFLLERYAAFTYRACVGRRFLVDHAPWPQQRIPLHVIDQSILDLAGGWSRQARLIGAHYSPGVANVTIGVPRTLDGALELLPHRVEPAHRFRRERQRRLEV